MGTCGPTKIRQIQKLYSQDRLTRHFTAMVKLEHCTKRSQGLREQAEAQVQRIINTSLTHIDRQQLLMVKERQEEIKQLEKDQTKSSQLIKKYDSLDRYVGLTALKANFSQYRDKVTLQFIKIKNEMEENMDNSFDQIKSQLQNDLIHFDERKVTPEDIETFFTRMKNSQKEEVRKAELDIQRQFNQALIPLIFRQKLKSVVSLEEVKELAKYEPDQNSESKAAGLQIADLAQSQQVENACCLFACAK